MKTNETAAVVRELQYRNTRNAFYAQCSDRSCIGYHGEATTDDSLRGPYSGKPYSYRAYAERDARSHNAIYHRSI